MGKFMKEIMKNPFMKTNSKEVLKFTSKIFTDVKKLSDADKNKYLVKINERDYLRTAEKYLRKLFSCEIKIFSADDKDIYDPKGKRSFAIPLRPAIFIE